MFFKITNWYENHNGMQYRTGLNTDILPFNPSGNGAPGGIYFADGRHICNFLGGDYIREVIVPVGEQVYKEKSQCKAHSVLLRRRRRLDKVNTWRWMIANGVNVHGYLEHSLRWAVASGHLDVVKFLVSIGADIGIYTRMKGAHYVILR